MKGDQKLWSILNDKLDMLRASNRLPEALRIAQAALDLAERAFKPGDKNHIVSLEKIGQLYDQAGNRTAAKPYLVKAHDYLEKLEPTDVRALFQSNCRLGFLCDNLGETDAAIRYYDAALDAGSKVEDVSYTELGTMLNNVALIYRRTSRSKSAEPYYLRALEIYEKQLGPDHPDVASVLNNLAVFYTNERRFAEVQR